MAIVGYLILFNARVIEFLKLHTDFCQGYACDVSWRLYFLYFGCFFIAIGAAVYGKYCPSLIKRYAGASDYFEAEKTYFSQPNNLEYLFGLIEAEKGGAAADPLDLKDTIVARKVALNLDHIHTLADIMGEHYVLQNLSHPSWRVFAYFSYAFGSFLLMVPTVLTFVQVACRAMQQFIGWF